MKFHDGWPHMEKYVWSSPGTTTIGPPGKNLSDTHCHQWSAASISICLRRMPYAATRTEWCVGGSAAATIRRTRRLFTALSQRGVQKIQLCGSESDERTPEKGIRNEHYESEWNTRSCNLWEKNQGTTLFQVCCRRVNIFPINFNFAYTRQAMSHFGTNFIHVINVSNVQNVLRVSVMCVMSRVRIFV